MAHIVSKHTFRSMTMIPELVQEALARDLKMEFASYIQEHSIPIVALGHSIRAQAPGGSGKTIAFCVGVLCKVVPERNYPQALIVSPNRELTRQTAEVLRSLVRRWPDLRIEELKKKPKDQGPAIRWNDPATTAHIVLGTPKLIKNALVKRKKPGPPSPPLSPYIDGANVKVFVVDEADDLVTSRDENVKNEKGELEEIVEKLLPKDCQVLLFSATYQDGNVLALCDKVFGTREYANVEIKKQDLKLKEIFQSSFDVSQLRAVPADAIGDNDAEKRKLSVLKELLESIAVEKCMIFCETRKEVDHVQVLLRRMNFSVEALHGAMDADVRDEVSDKFRTDPACRYLVCTDVLARGYDIPEVSTVVNYKLPMEHGSRPPRGDSATYVHRVARTGRFGRKGVAINLLDGPDSLRVLTTIVAEAYHDDKDSADRAGLSADVKPFDPNSIDAFKDAVKVWKETGSPRGDGAAGGASGV